MFHAFLLIVTLLITGSVADTATPAPAPNAVTVEQSAPTSVSLQDNGSGDASAEIVIG